MHRQLCLRFMLPTGGLKQSANYGVCRIPNCTTYKLLNSAKFLVPTGFPRTASTCCGSKKSGLFVFCYCDFQLAAFENLLNSSRAAERNAGSSSSSSSREKKGGRMYQIMRYRCSNSKQFILLRARRLFGEHIEVWVGLNSFGCGGRGVVDPQ